MLTVHNICLHITVGVHVQLSSGCMFGNEHPTDWCPVRLCSVGAFTVHTMSHIYPHKLPVHKLHVHICPIHTENRHGVHDLCAATWLHVASIRSAYRKYYFCYS